jgi:hypothetical protein
MSCSPPRAWGGGKRARAGENVGEAALGSGRQVKDDADRCVEILGQSAHECRQRFDASRGRAHDDEGRRPLVHSCVVSGGVGPKRTRFRRWRFLGG